MKLYVPKLLEPVRAGIRLLGSSGGGQPRMSGAGRAVGEGEGEATGEGEGDKGDGKLALGVKGWTEVAPL